MNGNALDKRQSLKIAVKAFYDFQDMRTRMGGRLKIKRDGEDQEIAEGQGPMILSERDREFFHGVYANAEKQEKIIGKWIEKEIKSMPIWTEFLAGVKGCGPQMAAIIVSEFDIHRADTVSKMWQFAGVNPGMVRGMKSVKTAKPQTYQPKDGEVVRRLKDAVIVRTFDQVRGDRKTAGYLAPFNGELRTKMVGVLGSCMIKSGSSYRLHYDNYKARLEREQGWSEESKGHRHNAAMRYMIKMFILDLYKAWRELEGLHVRPPYQEEYLGHKHGEEKPKPPKRRRKDPPSATV